MMRKWSECSFDFSWYI